MLVLEERLAKARRRVETLQKIVNGLKDELAYAHTHNMKSFETLTGAVLKRHMANLAVASALVAELEAASGALPLGTPDGNLKGHKVRG